MPGRIRKFLVFAVAACVLVGGVTSSFARQDEISARGRDNYVWSCLPCHGDAGRGDGPMDQILTKKPTDLTQIAKQNGGKFPFWLIYEIVSGRDAVAGHEVLQMPNFWERFRGEEQPKGYLPADVRILLLTHYLESIQVK